MSNPFQDVGEWEATKRDDLKDGDCIGTCHYCKKPIIIPPDPNDGSSEVIGCGFGGSSFHAECWHKWNAGNK